MIGRRMLVLTAVAGRGAGQWKIDDARGAVDGEPWSIRALLAFSLED